jgi:predicted anti-sigma-YlaC factor YlaD
MTCAAAREAILDFARNLSVSEDVRRAVDEHLGVCANCAAEFERQRDLTAALSALAAEAETWKASRAIE